jgi:translocation and assembly module TamA
VNSQFYSLLLCCLLAAPLLAAEPEIIIKGGTKSLRNNILQQLSIGDEKCKAPSWRLNAHLDSAEAEIASAAQALGYYQLTYESKLTRSNDCWQLAIQLIPGEPIRVAELRIDIMGDGRLDPLFQSLYDKPGIKIGDKFHHGKYESLKSRFESAATAHGYFDAYFALARVLVNETERSAVIELTYDTGKRYSIGNITIEQDILDDDFVQRYSSLATGDAYDTEKLLELKNLYNASNYYAATNINPDYENKQNNSVDINISLDERKRREYSIGGGYATDTGPRILLGFEDRYINRRGHFFNADVSAATDKKEAQLVYTIPLSNPAYEFLRIFNGYLKEETDVSWSRKRSIGSSYTYYQQNKWLQTYTINYEREDSIAGADPLKTSDLIIPSFTISRTKTDATPYPLKGWTISSRISGSPESIGSDYSFLQWHTRAKIIWGGDHGRLLLRNELGMTRTDDFRNLPVSVRFYAGGDASVRGYDYKSLGVLEEKENENGEMVKSIIGGSNLLVNSIEYDYMIGDTNWVAAVFYDQGNAYENSTIDFKRSLGAGVRWISPIGPVRIDFAKALDDEKSWAIHVTMGPDL